MSPADRFRPALPQRPGSVRSRRHETEWSRPGADRCVDAAASRASMSGSPPQLVDRPVVEPGALDRRRGSVPGDGAIGARDDETHTARRAARAAHPRWKRAEAASTSGLVERRTLPAVAVDDRTPILERLHHRPGRARNIGVERKMIATAPGSGCAGKPLAHVSSERAARAVNDIGA